MERSPSYPDSFSPPRRTHRRPSSQIYSGSWLGEPYCLKHIIQLLHRKNFQKTCYLQNTCLFAETDTCRPSPPPTTAHSWFWSGPSVFSSYKWGTE